MSDKNNTHTRFYGESPSWWFGNKQKKKKNRKGWAGIVLQGISQENNKEKSLCQHGQDFCNPLILYVNVHARARVCVCIRVRINIFISMCVIIGC